MSRIVLEYTGLVLCMTNVQVIFSNVSPPASDLLRIIIGISINHCIFECSIRVGCDSVGYKTVINVCKLYAKSEQVVAHEYGVITVPKVNIENVGSIKIILVPIFYIVLKDKLLIITD